MVVQMEMSAGMRDRRGSGRLEVRVPGCPRWAVQRSEAGASGWAAAMVDSVALRAVDVTEQAPAPLWVVAWVFQARQRPAARPPQAQPVEMQVVGSLQLRAAS